MRAPIVSNLYWAMLLMVAIFCGAGGSFIGYHMRGDVAVPEVVDPAPGVQQPDGSVVAPRVAPPSKPTPAPHKLPAGSREERRMAVSVQPDHDSGPPVRLDLSLVQLDGGRRLIASSPDGKIVDSMDMPIESVMLAARSPDWAVGLSLDTDKSRWGAWVDRDMGRLRVGVELQESAAGVAPRMRVGWRF